MEANLIVEFLNSITSRINLEKENVQSQGDDVPKNNLD